METAELQKLIEDENPRLREILDERYGGSTLPANVLTLSQGNRP